MNLCASFSVLFAILLLIISINASDYLDYYSSGLDISSEEKQEPKSVTKFTDDEAKGFIARSEKIISSVQKKYSFPEGILMDVDLSENLLLMLDIDDSAEEIINISKAAKKYLKSDYNDPIIKPALIQLRRVGGIYSFGAQMIQMELNVKNLNFLLNDESITSYKDNEFSYSKNDLLAMDIKKSFENIEGLKYYWEQWAQKLDTDSTDEYYSDVISEFRTAAEEMDMSVPELLYNGYSTDLMVNLDEVIKELTPFYRKLHAYVRSKLFKKYGAGVIKPNGPIPQHIYDKLKEQHWRLDEDFSSDFSKVKLTNYDELLTSQKFGVENITELAEHFYESIGFDHLSEKFWKENILRRTKDCNIYEEIGTVDDTVPNATLTNCKDGTINFDTFTKYHVYFGQLHNALLKKKQPLYFFPNYYLGPAVGKAVSLSAQSIKHLNTISLVEDLGSQTIDEALMRNLILALETVNGIFSAYVRAKVMIEYQNGDISDGSINARYWKMLEKYAGVEPPVDRPEDAKDIPYDYYIKFNKNEDLLQPIAGEILGYQFFLALCQKIGFTGQLHDCDFYNNTAVGAVLRDILKQGSSKSFSELIATLLPKQKELNANGILTYYEPIQTWLTQHMKSKNLTVGWVPSTKQLSKDPYTSKLSAKRFIIKNSRRIFELYDQIAADLFSNQDKANEFIEANENVFWKISNSAVAATELKEISLQAKKIETRRLRSKELERQVKRLAKIGDLFVLGEELTEFLKHKNSVLNIATTKNIPAYPGDTNVTLSYMPDIKNIFINTTDKEVLQYYWETMRQVNADWAKEQLNSMISSFKKAADMLDISVNEFWYRNYDTDFIEQMESVIEDLYPLYSNLYTYIRALLAEKYDITNYEAIPHHLYQQVMLQTWTNYSIIESIFPAKNLPPNEEFIVKKAYDAKQILKVADDFYTSLGFDPLADDFWERRLKPQDVEYKHACTATIYDMTPTVYMRYCENVSFRKFLQAHGYLGRIHYAVEKKSLPAYYFDSYALEYPVGEAVILSASSPKHLLSLGMDYEFTDDVLMNRMIRMGIHTLFNIHMHFIHTKVVNDYLEGTVEDKDIVKHYWVLMLKYAGVDPPSDRKQDEFDFPYEFYTDLERNHQLKKFVSEVLGYQFYDALCQLSGHEGELSNCDIFGSKKAGKSLKKMMRLGSKSPLKTVLKSIIPETPQLDAKSILKYYKPLQEWLEKANGSNDTEVNLSFGSTSKKFLRRESFIDEEEE